MYSKLFILYSLLFIFYSLLFILYSLLFILYSLLFILYILQNITEVWTDDCTWNVHTTIKQGMCNMQIAQCIRDNTTVSKMKSGPMPVYACMYTLCTFILCLPNQMVFRGIWVRCGGGSNEALYRGNCTHTHTNIGLTYKYQYYYF